METRHPIPAIDDLQPFDTCVVVGRLADAAAPVNLTTENVLPVLDRYGIREALVTSNFARLHRPHRRGNAWTVEFCTLSPRLHPVWVFEPPVTPGREAARAAVAEMRGQGARVARLLMGQGGAAPLLWWWQDLLKALRERRIPCLVDFGSCDYFHGSTNGVPNDAQVDGLRAIVLAFPNLHFILSHACGGLGIAGSVLPLMQRCPNLHLDISSIINHAWRAEVLERVAKEFPSIDFIAGHWFAHSVLRLPNVYCNMWSLLPLGALERGVREYGAEKFLYGSDAFLNPISAGIGLIVHADLPDEDKRKILGLNQAKLLEKAGVLPAKLRQGYHAMCAG